MLTGYLPFHPISPLSDSSVAVLAGLLYYRAIYHSDIHTYLIQHCTLTKSTLLRIDTPSLVFGYHIIEHHTLI